MASGWYCEIDGDVTVTAQVKFYLNGAEVILPADWRLHVTTEGGKFRVTSVQRGEEYLALPEALALAQLVMTCSRKGGEAKPVA